MKYVLLLIAIAVALMVLIVRTSPQPLIPAPATTKTSPSTSAQPTTASTSPTSIAKPTTTPKTPVKVKTVDPKVLDQIQAGLNQAQKTLNQITAPAPVLLNPLPQSELYAKAQTRVVNFFCELGNGVVAASGILISPDGYVLTNAHVAENFADISGYECLIRQGSPAQNIGYAKIVMFPKEYLNLTSSADKAAIDVSIWKINNSTGPTPLPESWPYYNIDPNYYPQKNETMVTFSYPSELLGYETLLKSLNMLFGETVVSDFDTDLIISNTSLSSQLGSSGGILVDPYTNNFAGLIFGVSKDETINQRKLFSLTPHSVERVVESETGQTLAQFLSQ